jgi:NAD(P)-dependent dehydrogenase (short-subunit alcohol dehydrogenase family)
MALILVTGASTGLGLATASSLADLGHAVVLHARRPDRVQGNPIVKGLHGTVYADLSRLDEVVRLADDVNGFGSFDAVIHNAGVLDGPDVLAVNTVAPYVLTALMHPPRRAVYLSSSMHRGGSTQLEHMRFDAPARRRGSYEDSKLYVTALALAVAERSDVLSHAVDPGWVPTRMGGPGATDSIEAGHRTQEWLATADESEISPSTGGYWYHAEPRRPHPATRDESFQRELLVRLEERTGVSLVARPPQKGRRRTWHSERQDDLEAGG